MSKPNNNDLKQIVLAATSGRTIASQRKPLPSERAATKLIGDWMKKSGFDHQALAELKKQHRREDDRPGFQVWP